MAANPLAPHLVSGRWGEETARMYLQEKGYRVLDVNWHCREGEIDIICRDGKAIVFVEVRTRRKNGLVAASSTLDVAKQRRLVAAASKYLSKHALWKSPCRFDLVAVTMDDNAPTLEHFEHVVDARAVGGGHAAWQPW